MILVVRSKLIKKILLYNLLTLNKISFHSWLLYHTVHTFPLKSIAVTIFFALCELYLKELQNTLCVSPTNPATWHAVDLGSHLGLLKILPADS